MAIRPRPLASPRPGRPEDALRQASDKIKARLVHVEKELVRLTSVLVFDVDTGTTTRISPPKRARGDAAPGGGLKALKAATDATAGVSSSRSSARTPPSGGNATAPRAQPRRRPPPPLQMRTRRPPPRIARTRRIRSDTRCALRTRSRRRSTSSQPVARRSLRARSRTANSSPIGGDA